MKDKSIYNNMLLLLSKDTKTYKEHTIRSYSDRINWLKDNLKIESNNISDIIKDPNIVIKVIDKSDISVSSKKLTYIALYSLAKKLKLAPTTLTLYRHQMTLLNEVDAKLKGDTTIKDKVNWATWDEVRSVYDIMTEGTLENVQDKLIIGLYTRFGGHVLRLDFANTRVITKDEVSTDNTFIYNKKNYIFNLNEYKTEKIYGQQKIKIVDKDLIRLIDLWFDNFNTNKKYLLVNYRNRTKPLSVNSLSKRVVEIFIKYLNKHLTVNTLRHISETNNINKAEYNSMTLNDKIVMHKKLQHSLHMAHYYAKAN